jgi:hypothetical protein
VTRIAPEKGHFIRLECEGEKLSVCVVGREPRRVGEKGAWVADMRLGIGRTKTVKEGQGRKERLWLMANRRGQGW